MTPSVTHEFDGRPTVWWRSLLGLSSGSSAARVGVDVTPTATTTLESENNYKTAAPPLRSAHLPIPQRGPVRLSQSGVGAGMTSSPDLYFQGEDGRPRRGVLRDKLLKGAATQPSVLILPSPLLHEAPSSPAATDKWPLDDEDTASGTVDESESRESSEESGTNPRDDVPSHLYLGQDEDEHEHERASGVYVAPPAAPQRRPPTRLAVSLSDEGEDSDDDASSTSSKPMQKGSEEGLGIPLDLSPEPAGRSGYGEDKLDAVSAPLPVTHGEYFEGSLLAPPVERQVPHSRLSFLHVHLNESDEESSHSGSGDSASSDEVIDRRQPYYQLYKLEKREKRIEREENMKIRQPKTNSAFSIPHAHLYDPRGKPKGEKDFEAPARSPPRNARVEIGLKRKAEKKSRSRQKRFQQERNDHSMQFSRDEDWVSRPSLAIQGLGSDSEEEENDIHEEDAEAHALRSPPPRLRAANIKSRTSPLAFTRLTPK
jgi:hypothetical protein